MSTTPLFAAIPACASPCSKPGKPTATTARQDRRATPGRMLATWLWRQRYRRDLEEMAKTNPHLIEDIGLKRWQVEEELAKPFWKS